MSIAAAETRLSLNSARALKACPERSEGRRLGEGASPEGLTRLRTLTGRAGFSGTNALGPFLRHRAESPQVQPGAAH